MANLFGRMLPKDKNKKHKVSGTAKTFLKMMIPHTVAGGVILGTVLLVVISIFVYISEYDSDKNYSKNNPKLLYEQLGSDDLNELICIAGNEEDGYYLAFKDGYEERLKEVVNKYDSNGNYISIDIELLSDMIMAELFTQYPDLGGKIGKEADVELEEPSQEEEEENEEEEEEQEEKTENIMDIPEMFQNDGGNVTFPSHRYASFPGTGCGPACIAMIMTYLTGEEVTFQDVATWCDNPAYAGKYFNGSGSNGPIFEASAVHWDVGEVTYTDDPDKVVQSLLDGKPVVSLQTGGIFANVQHYIVLRGVDANGRIYVNNPNRDTAQDENYDMASQIDATSSGYWIYENGTPSSKSSVPKLILANDTGEGQDGFQGAIRIRRVMPNKGIGEVKNVGSGESSTVVESLGTKEKIPDDIKEDLGKLKGATFDTLSYLTIPYYNFDGTVSKGNMIVNTKLADEVLLIFQELYNIKYPIEGMSINANYEESTKANNTAGFYNNDSLVDANAEEDQKLHITGQAIDINPQINPNIISDNEYLPDNAEKYVTERKEQEGWQDIEKEACITKDSRIVSIFEKYGWEWKADGSYSGDTGHFEKQDLENVQKITNSVYDNYPEEDGEKDEDTEENNNSENNENSDSENNSEEESTDENTENEKKRQEVKDYIEDYASMRGKWSVYAKALNSGVEIVDYDKDAKMQSASVIKLFVMATVYDQRQEGNSNAQNISDSTISSMITVSDNDATNSIITQLGGGSESAGLQIINQYIQEHGYTNTEINRLMLRDTSNGDNYTSSADVAKILEEIYNGTCVSQSASEAMLGYLKNQQRKNKIPAGVPGSVETANKTGELDDVQNDAAIIFKDGAPYILVVMCSNVTDTNQVINDIVEISKKVYGVDSETITSDEDVKTTINSKVIDLKYIPEEKFDEMIENDDQSVLEYYTLDGNWKLITAKWSYTTTDGIKLSKNSAVNYITTLQKYTTPFEYMLDYYIDMTDDDWINDFIDVAMKSEFIIAVQDNVTTREDNVTTTLEYMDGFVASSNSGIEVTETVSDTIELTYGDTWFVKFSKKDSYEAAALQSTTVSTESGANVTGDKGALVGNYSTTSYCYTCNDVGGNFGTNIGNHDNVLIPNFSIAVHSYDPNLKTGDYVWIEGNIYRVDDFGTGKAGNWLDVYVEPQSDIRGPCCGNSEWAERYNVPVYRATNIREKTAADTEATTTKDGTKLINTVADLKGKVTDTKSVTTTWQAGPVREVRREEGTYYIGSIFTTVTNTHNIAYKYVTGDYEVTGNEDKFIKLFEDNPGSEQLLKPEWLLENIEAGDRTAQFLDLTKYLLYKLTGYSYGVTEFDFSIYEPDDFKSTSRGGGLEQFIRWLHEWEGINGSISEDGTKYIIGTDGYGHPTVGYGIDIINGGFTERFKAAGYSTEIGAEVDKEFVDNLEKEEINQALETVEEKCAGLDLTQYQKYALASRIFNCGAAGAFTTRNGKDFVAAYTEYWDQEKDLEYKVPPNDAMYNHPLYANYMYLPNTAKGSGFSQGLENRRKAEWLLFKTGYYDRIDEYYEEGGSGDILEACDEVAEMWRSRRMVYSTNEEGDVPLPTTVEEALQSSKSGCCATYVSTVLYRAGLLTAEQIEKYEWHWTGNGGVPDMLKDAGWTLHDISDLQPGDVINHRTVHVMIYAGDGLIWDQHCGVWKRGYSEAPYTGPFASSYVTNGSVEVWRAPGK